MKRFIEDVEVLRLEQRNPIQSKNVTKCDVYKDDTSCFTLTNQVCVEM